MKVKLEETPGGRDTAKNIVRNDKERNEKKQVQWNEKEFKGTEKMRVTENSKGDYICVKEN